MSSHVVYCFIIRHLIFSSLSARQKLIVSGTDIISITVTSLVCGKKQWDDMQILSSSTNKHTHAQERKSWYNEAPESAQNHHETNRVALSSHRPAPSKFHSNKEREYEKTFMTLTTEVGGREFELSLSCSTTSSVSSLVWIHEHWSSGESPSTLSSKTHTERERRRWANYVNL